jgi:hypothetical protein
MLPVEKFSDKLPARIVVRDDGNRVRGRRSEHSLEVEIGVDGTAVVGPADRRRGYDQQYEYESAENSHEKSLR